MCVGPNQLRGSDALLHHTLIKQDCWGRNLLSWRDGTQNNTVSSLTQLNIIDKDAKQKVILFVRNFLQKEKINSLNSHQKSIFKASGLTLMVSKKTTKISQKKNPERQEKIPAGGFFWENFESIKAFSVTCTISLTSLHFFPQLSWRSRPEGVSSREAFIKESKVFQTHNPVEHQNKLWGHF